MGRNSVTAKCFRVDSVHERIEIDVARLSGQPRQRAPPPRR